MFDASAETALSAEGNELRFVDGGSGLVLERFSELGIRGLTGLEGREDDSEPVDWGRRAGFSWRCSVDIACRVELELELRDSRRGRKEGVKRPAKGSL